MLWAASFFPRLFAIALAIPALLSACGSAKSSASGTPFPGVGSLSDGTSACGYVDALSAERAACQFGAGARVADTLGELTAARRAIRHVIVIVHENHSFDNLFGMTGHGMDGLPAGASNPTAFGGRLNAFHLTTLCTADLGHSFEAMHAEYDSGRMDGFAVAGGPTAMGYYDDADHPFYTWAATTFASSDRNFGSVLGPTWPNRDYLLAATSQGIKETGERALDAPTLFDELDAAQVPWADYDNGASPALQTDLGWTTNPVQVKPYAEFATALASGTLEPVVFIDSGEDTHDEHPGRDGIDRGERFVADIAASAFQSPLWGEARDRVHVRRERRLLRSRRPTAGLHRGAIRDRIRPARFSDPAALDLGPRAGRLRFARGAQLDQRTTLDSGAVRSARAHRARRKLRRLARSIRFLRRSVRFGPKGRASRDRGGLEVPMSAAP